ncbi:MAG: VOC family protein [Bacteroidales bacterium]|nr:VOC family protein [Bacteroidales bacterium]
MAQKTTLNPYITFPGNCREAMEFYKTVLNGELEIMPFEGSPMEVPDDYKQKIMHSSLKFGDALLMASDNQPGQEVNFGDGIFLSIAASSLEEAQNIFNSLSSGGHVIMPFEDTFWGSKFGMFTDKFGIGWMVGFDKEQQG